MNGYETMVSYNVTYLFTCIPVALAVNTEQLSHDHTLRDRTQLNPDPVGALFQYHLFQI